MTAHLVSAFAPTVWSGREPFPVGPIGITAFGCGTLLLIATAFAAAGRSIDDAVSAWSARLRGVRTIAMAGGDDGALRRRRSARASRAATTCYWKHELVASFFRPDGFAFEPTARRHAVAERDAVLRAAYPRPFAGAHRKNVVLIIVDSLRADRMQVYGYSRPTTPFLSRAGAERTDEAGARRVLDLFRVVLRHHEHAGEPRVPGHQRRDVPAAGRPARPGLSDVVPAVGQPPRVERAAALLSRERRHVVRRLADAPLHDGRRPARARRARARAAGVSRISRRSSTFT